MAERWRLVVEVETDNLGTIRRQIEGDCAAAVRNKGLDRGWGSPCWVEKAIEELDEELTERWKRS